MAIKPGAERCVLLEQIIEDLVTGITIQIARQPSGGTRISLYGNLPNGNRDLIFDESGANSGSGTGRCWEPPSWLKMNAARPQE